MKNKFLSILLPLLGLCAVSQTQAVAMSPFRPFVRINLPAEENAVVRTDTVWVYVPVAETAAEDTTSTALAEVDSVIDSRVLADIRPAPLQPGDTIAIFDISNYADSTALAYGISLLQDWGLNVRLADNLFKKNGRYDGTTEERIKATQDLIDDPRVKAMISVRGGYGASLVTPYLDYSPLFDNPKWIIGYSDVTSLHIALNNLGIESLHGPMATRIEGDTTSIQFLHQALFGEAPGLAIETNEFCRVGEAEGRLVGGNLSLIYSLQGTGMDLNMKDAILFIEDVDEDSYAVDRMLQNLLLSGKLDDIKGIIVGQFTNFNDAKGMDLPLHEIIYSKLGDRQIPVMYRIEAGHEWNVKKSAPNYSLYLGRRIHLKVGSGEAYFEYID